MITSRMKRIIMVVLESNDYITISEVAQVLSVSTRTVLRELDDVGKWLESNGAFLHKKKGTGIYLDKKNLTRQEILDLLNEAKSELIYSPSDRSIILRATLLQYNEPTKLFSLTHLLNVTESTIGNDLEHLEPWFFNYNIQVIKRPGMGIILEGSEKAKRKAIVALIYEHFHMVELIEVISRYKKNSLELPRLESKLNGSVFELLSTQSLSFIRDMIVALEKEMGYQFADNGYIALAIRFSVTLRRKKFWGDIEIDEVQCTKLQKDKVYLFVKEFLAKDKENPFNELPELEVMYLVMHVKGTKLRETGDYNKISMIEDFKVIQLAKEFIEKTEVETGIYLTDNEELLIGLVKHLRPTLYRLKMDLDIINPLLDEIRQMYPKLFKAIRKSVSVIEDKEMLEVPDDEIAYLATHIGAVIHKQNQSSVKKYNAVVACMYGIGASQLLLAQLKKNFANIHIVDVVSVMDEQITDLKENEVDLLITTVPIQGISMPSVLINPILKEEDVNKINSMLSKLTPKKPLLKEIRLDRFKNRLITLKEYLRILDKLLQNYSYIQLNHISNMMALINYVSDEIAGNKEERKLLEKAFALREEKGSTILGKKGMMLLHCRADIEKEVSLQIIQMEQPMFVSQEKGKIPVDTFVVMVAPVVLNQKILEVLSEISRNIISEDLMDIIKKKNPKNIENELSNILEKFYQKLVYNPE